MPSTRVYEIERATISLAKSKPPFILVEAHGTVSSSGWSNPSLGLWIYIDPPRDGIQDVDFIAECPPTGSIVLPKFMSVTAHISIGPVEPADYWGQGKPLAGFRIHASLNKLEVKMDDNKSFDVMQVR